MLASNPLQFPHSLAPQEKKPIIHPKVVIVTDLCSSGFRLMYLSAHGKPGVVFIPPESALVDVSTRSSAPKRWRKSALQGFGLILYQNDPGTIEDEPDVAESGFPAPAI